MPPKAAASNDLGMAKALTDRLEELNATAAEFQVMVGGGEEKLREAARNAPPRPLTLRQMRASAIPTGRRATSCARATSRRWSSRQRLGSWRRPRTCRSRSVSCRLRTSPPPQRTPPTSLAAAVRRSRNLSRNVALRSTCAPLLARLGRDVGRMGAVAAAGVASAVLVQAVLARWLHWWWGPGTVSPRCASAPSRCSVRWWNGSRRGGLG